MSIKSIYRRAFVFSVFFLTALFTAVAQTQIKKHVVQGGETLYRLSVNYGVTVDQILQYNPSLKQGALRTGATVFIPVIGVNGNDVANIKTVHKVKRKETLWSISQEYGISIDDLKVANPEMFKSDYELKKGSKINIPFPSALDVAPTREQPQLPAKTKTQPAKGYSPVKIAVILPFSEGVGSNRCIEYYRGLLMATEQMKAEGKNIQIYAYDEPDAKSSMASTLNIVRNKNVHLIVGPLYFDHFNELSRFAKTEQIKTLIPFSSKATEIKNNPNLFLLNAPEEEKHDFAISLFMKNFTNYKVVFILSGNGNEKRFTNTLRSRLIHKGIEVSEVSVNASNAQLLSACNKKKLTIFVPDGSSDEDFKHIVPRISQFKKANKQINTALLGFPEWQKFVSTHRVHMHEANTYIFTNTFFNPWSETTNALKHKYMKWFNSDILEVTPRMFMLGYDSGLTFMNGLAQFGKDFNTQDLGLPLQQSDIAFKKISNNGGFINASMWFIHYRTDFEIEKIAEK